LRFLVSLFAAALLAGCAAPRPALFAVVPAADGHIGTIVVEGQGERRVIHSAYGAERIRADGRIETVKLDEQQVRQEFGATLAALPTRPAYFTLYFLSDSDELTPDSQRELKRVFDELKRRALPDILVIGHTDTFGSDWHNDQLSKARAERMKELLADMGIPADRIQTAGRGKRELLVPTEDNVHEPRNRRVEIDVR
jgi:outer membrane protein OmpA-like peptidoglycan-associated protein